jgi:hypothetical protein
MVQILTIIIGLIIFEIITSIDNAVVNAHVLKTVPEKFRKFFLFWGILIAVFLIRGVLTFLIVWIANPNLNFIQILTFVFSGDYEIQKYVERSQSLLLLAGDVYLLFVFLGWLFLEEK